MHGLIDMCIDSLCENMWAKLRWLCSSSSSPRSGDAPLMEREYYNHTTTATKSKAPLTVEEEYNMALRTKSFLDLWAKAHHHHNKVSQHAEAEAEADAEAEAEGEEERQNSHSSSSCFDSSRCCGSIRVPEFVLEPSEDALRAAAARVRRRRRRALLLDYFDTTSEACGACVALLSSVGRARCHHRRIRRLLLRLSLNTNTFNANTLLNDEGEVVQASNNNWAWVSRELARHVEGRDNPLSAQSLGGFHRAHARYTPLAARLTAAHRRALRRARLARRARTAGRILLLGACGSNKNKNQNKNKAEVDAAAKGAYIVGRDLDTVSRMVRRAHDEVEHGRDVARIALRAYDGGGGGGGGGGEVAREAAREVELGAVELAEQLAELEEHVCLCLITINRSRRLVAREMISIAARTPFL